MRESEKFNLGKYARVLCFMSIYLFIDLCIYNILTYYGKNNYFFFIPLILFGGVILGNRILKIRVSEKLNITITTITFISLCIIENLKNIKSFIFVQSIFSFDSTIRCFFRLFMYSKA